MEKMIVLSITKKQFDFQQYSANLQILYKEGIINLQKCTDLKKRKKKKKRRGILENPHSFCKKQNFKHDSHMLNVMLSV